MAEFDAYRDSYRDEVGRSLEGTGVSSDFVVRLKAERLKAICADHFGARDDLAALDFGCGVGVYHPHLTGAFTALQGVDVSAECLDVAKASHPWASYSAYDGRRLPFPDASFDVAFAITVFHHVPPEHWEESAADIARVLRPGGLFVIFEHNPWNPATRWVVSRCEFDQDAVLLSHRTAERLMRAAGLAPVTSRHILTAPLDMGWARTVDGWFEGAPLGAQYLTMGAKAAP